MIKTKKDLAYYLESDRIALKKNRKRPRFVGDEIWTYQRLLRRAEYWHNCGNKYIALFLFYRMRKYGIKLGYSIPLNVFGPGLSIAHIGTIIVSKGAKIGANCRIHVDVNIGAVSGESEAPKIGDNVYIAPGSKIFGNIVIASDIAIGANSVVNNSFLNQGITIAGIPAKKISDKGSEKHLIKATQYLTNKF